MEQLTLFDMEPPPATPEPKPWENTTATAADYAPTHPWYYLLGGRHLAVDDIPPAESQGRDPKWPKDAAKRRQQAEHTLEQLRIGLAKDIERYQDIQARGVAALSRYDREICYGGDPDMAVASSLALTVSHIAWGKGRVRDYELEVARSVAATEPLITSSVQQKT